MAARTLAKMGSCSGTRAPIKKLQLCGRPVQGLVRGSAGDISEEELARWIRERMVILAADLSADDLMKSLVILFYA